MNPWIVLGILVAATNDRSRESAELESLRKSVGDLKDQLAAATARNALAPPPQPEPQPYWCEPAPPIQSTTDAESYPGEFVQSIIDDEADYLWRMNDRTVEDYGGQGEAA